MSLCLNCSGGSSERGNVAKLLKVAWMTLPLGIIITFAGCIFVLWWQELSYSSEFAQAIWINGERNLWYTVF